MAEVTIKGLAELRATLSQFSDRRFDAAIATALSRTAVLVRDQMRRQMERELDRPTKYTLNSLYTVPATAQKLDAKVRFKDDSAGSGTPATKYMLPNVEGGGRRVKRFEYALRAAGALPDGWFVTPGQGAVLDANGNVSRGQIIQVLSQLRITLVAGTTRNMGFGDRRSIRAQQRAGGRFFVIRPGGKTQPGIYQREFVGRNVTPVFIFVRSATYRKRFKFYEGGQALVERFLPQQVERSVREQLQRIAVRKA